MEVPNRPEARSAVRPRRSPRLWTTTCVRAHRVLWKDRTRSAAVVANVPLELLCYSPTWFSFMEILWKNKQHRTRLSGVPARLQFLLTRLRVIDIIGKCILNKCRDRQAWIFWCRYRISRARCYDDACKRVFLRPCQIKHNLHKIIFHDNSQGWRIMIFPRTSKSACQSPSKLKMHLVVFG